MAKRPIQKEKAPYHYTYFNRPNTDEEKRDANSYVTRRARDPEDARLLHGLLGITGA